MKQEINNLIEEIEKGLIKLEINTNNPHVSLDYQTQLGGYLSSCIGLIEKLDTLEAQFFIDNRSNHKSDNATKKAWEVSETGIKQKFWETRIKRIEVLIKRLEVIFYQGRDEMKLKELK